MNKIPKPITQPDANDRTFGRKLAKLIATMRRLPQPPVNPTRSMPMNGMTAYGEWDSLRQ